MKSITRTLIGVAVAPLVILLIVASLPFVLANEARAAIALRVFRRREAGRVYLVCTTKPYIVVVTPRALLHRSLNASLQQLKARPKKSEDTRRACADIIQRIEDDLRASACTLHVAAQT